MKGDAEFIQAEIDGLEPLVASLGDKLDVQRKGLKALEKTYAKEYERLMRLKSIRNQLGEE